MSGYDALDELYERLRGQENARRAGEITPETIRAARGGVADGYGRELHVVDENAAGGDSEPLAGDSRDSRERIEADLLALTEMWRDHDGDFMKVYSSVAYAQVKELLDRQAAITRAECDKPNWEYCETCELHAELDEYDQTHMLLPVDADGVPIRVGDLIEYGSKGERLEVTHIGLTKHGDPTIAYRRPNGTLDCSCIGSECHHVEPRTVEDVLRELADAARLDRARELDDGDIEGYAAEIRELMGGDA